ncbi:hypothetical protein, partial [Gilliamella sp. HK7]
MNRIKYLLIIILLLPQFAHSIYRIYVGNIGNKKVELYMSAISDSDFHILYVDDETYEITYLALPDKINNGYFFKSYSDNEDSLTFKNFDFSENKAKSEDDFLIGTSLKFGDFKLKKVFEYNVIWNNGNEKNYKDSKKLVNNTEFKNIEFLQRDLTENFYFKLLLSKKKKENIKITGVNVYSKKNGKLVQTINNIKGYGFFAFNAIQIGDFDFDGNENDFLLADGETHAANVPQTYYIYDGLQNKFIDPNLEGYTIRFDSEKKIATSTKTCGNEFIDPTSITINKMYYFNENTKKYNYLDQYCIAYDNK